MIALLPLRGWSAQLMGVEMAASQLPAVMQAMGQDAGHNTMHDVDQTVSMHSMSPDCPMHAAHSVLDSAPDPAQDLQTSHSSQSDDGQHTGCQSCQLCMPLLGLSPASASGADRCPMPLPQAHGRFVSAEVAQAVKPPIF